MWDIRDPLNNYAYEVHQYPSFSPTHQPPRSLPSPPFPFLPPFSLLLMAHTIITLNKTRYLDVQSSGQDPVCYSSTFGSKAYEHPPVTLPPSSSSAHFLVLILYLLLITCSLRQFTEWARAYNKMGFLGEFGGSNSKVCLEAIDDIITYMDQNTDVWLGWYNPSSPLSPPHSPLPSSLLSPLLFSFYGTN